MHPAEVNEASEDVIEIRCPGGVHFKLINGDTIEVKCKHCSDRNTVVLHRYSLPNLEPQKTIVRGRGARVPRKEVP